LWRIAQFFDFVRCVLSGLGSDGVKALQPCDHAMRRSPVVSTGKRHYCAQFRAFETRKNCRINMSITQESDVIFDSSNRSRNVCPADQLPTSGFMGRRKYLKRDLLSDLVSRLHSGNLAHLQVPPMLLYRLSCLCKRWAPDLQVFMAQVLESTGHLDYFFTQAAALDHHTERFGLLRTSISAAELAMNPRHRAALLEPLPTRVDELQQVCAAVAFLFDMGKVMQPGLLVDSPRELETSLAPYTDLQRCWRSSWEALSIRHPILAAWFDQLGRQTPDPIASVRAARSLVRNAVVSAWHQGS
jgi:hypothetical protein